MFDLASLGIKIDSSDVRAGVNELDKLTDAGGRAEGATAGLTTATDRLNRALQLLGITSVTAALLGAAEKARQFQDALAEVATQVDTTVFSMQKLSDEALRQAQAYGSTPLDQVNAYYEIISAGAADAATATETLTAANKLAVGGITDTATAADVLTSVLNAYGPAAGSAADVSDALFIAVRNGKTTMEEMAVNIGKVAPIASQLGVSFDELTASIAALTSGGIATAEATTGVRAILASVAKPTDEAAKLAQKLGIEFNSAGLQARGFGGFMADIATKTGGSQDALAILFGGVEALIPALALSGEAGKKFAQTMEDMAGKAGATEEAFKKVMEGPGKQMDLLFSALSVKVIEFGGALLSVAIPAMTFLTENLDAVIDGLIAVTAGFVTYKAIVLLTALAHTPLIATVLTVTAQFGLAAGASVLYTAALSALSVAARGALVALGPLAIALGVATAAYYLLRDSTDAARVATGEYTSATATLEAIQKKTEAATNSLAAATGEARKEALANATALKKEAEGYLAVAQAALIAAEAQRSQIKAFADKTRATGGLAAADPRVRQAGGPLLATGAQGALDQSNANLAQAEKNAIGAANEVARIQGLIDNFSVAPLAGLAGALGDADKSAKKASSSVNEFEQYLAGLKKELGDVGKTDAEVKTLEVALKSLAAEKAGMGALAAEIRSVGAAVVAAEQAQLAKDYLKALTDETGKIGKTAIEIKQIEVYAAAAKAPLGDLKFAILAAGLAWEDATKKAATTSFTKNTLAPLELQVALLGQSEKAQALATVAAEREAIVLEQGEEAWKRYHAARVSLIEDHFATEELEDYLSYLDQAAALTERAAQAMSSAFGSVGTAIGNLAVEFQNYSADRVAAELRLQKLEKDGKKATLEYAAAINAQRALEVNHYRNVAGVAKTFFKEGTAGYKALETAEKALAVIQLINTARSVAAGAARMFEVLGPFGFPAVAAMLGVMASLGFSGGKGGSASVPTAEDIQAAQGTGSVLGDSKAKSDSITASLEIMSKNSNKNLEYSNSMVRSLRAIENNIGKLTSLLAKQLGVSGAFDTSGLGLGTTSGGLSGTLFGLAGGLPGLIASKLPIIGDIIGAVAKFVFSTKKTVTLIDQGLTFGAQTVADILENGLAGSTYQTVEIKKKKKLFGISISNSTNTSTTTNPLGGEIGNQVSLIIGSLKDGILAAADILGVQGAAAALDAFSVNIGKISLKDLTADEIGKELEAVFSKLGDDMARAAIPGLDAFQKAGEGLFETLSRLAKDYITIDTTLQSIGRTFGAVGASSVAAREELIDLFGSLDDFVEQTAFFRENFLTEAQQIAPIASALSAELTRLGLTGVTTKDAFAQTVLGLDLTTTAGQEMYAALMAIAPAFNAVSDYTTKLNKTTADGLKSTIDQYGKFVESLTKYRDQLLQGELRVGNVYARARAQFLATSLLAATGDAGGLGSLEGVSKTFLAASRDNASTLTQYQRDVAAVVSAVDKGLFAATETVDYAQLQLAALDNSVALLTSIDANIAAIVPANQTPAPIAGAPAGTATPDNTAMANQLAQLQAGQSAMAADIAKTNAAMLRFYNRWEGEGLLVRTDADTPLNVVTE